MTNNTHLTKRRFSAVCTTWLLACAAPAGAVDLDQRVEFQIPPGRLSEALIYFSKQAHVQVLTSGERTASAMTAGISGTHSLQDALHLLLKESGLVFKVMTENAIAVSGGDSQTGSQHRPASSQQTLRVAQLTEAAPSQAREQDFSLEEIVVTAQKRVERLQDVPVPVTALNTDLLVNANKLRLQDFYTQVPGLNLTALGDASSPSISIRGVTTGGFVSSTVGIVVDDIPFGPSSAASGILGIAPDFDPSDLVRIEVLRGPQGTLYGANSLGGLLKYVTADPSLEGVSGRVQVGTTNVKGGDDLGYAVRGSINLPLGDSWAVLASGSTRREPGYVDNILRAEDDINRTDAESGRIAALWRPSEELSVKLSALYQHAQRNGSSDVYVPSPLGPRPDLGDLQNSLLVAAGGSYDQDFQAYSITVNAAIGKAQLVSLSGYSVSDMISALDGSPLYGGMAQALFGVPTAAQYSDGETSKLTQELRLTLPLGERLEWLLGGFYTEEEQAGYADLVAVQPTSGARAGRFARFDITGSYEEYAAFTDFTFQVTDRFDIQAGARVGHIETSYNQFFGGGLPLFEVPPVADLRSKDDVVTYLLTPRLRISSDLMMYGRFATGYRPGGHNSAIARAAGLPASYDHDTTENYELGMKGAILDGALSFDASVYYIDWKDVQIQVRDTVNALLTYNLNAAAARSQGAELSLTARPLDGLTISAWGAYNEAEFTDVPTSSALTVRAGDQLPYSARRSGNLSVDQEFPVLGNATAFIGASASYVGDRRGRFFAGAPQEVFPSYAQIDLRAGLRFDAWSINSFITNVADKRGVLRSGRDASVNLRYAYSYIQPRTIGVFVGREF